MIASNSAPRWRTSISTSPARRSPCLRPDVAAISCDLARSLRQPRLRARLGAVRRTAHPSASISRFASGLIDRPRSRRRPARASGSGFVHGRRSASDESPRMRLRPCEHGIDRVEHVRAERNECLKLHVSATAARRPCKAGRSAAACSSNSRGAAPWNEKIDCFSSPTAKIVRVDRRARRRRRRIRRSALR